MKSQTIKTSGERRRKVFVAMSGGVDSSVAAYLLNKATSNNFSKLFGRPTPKGFRGYDVTGVFMRCWNDGPDATVGVNCTSEQDAEDARRVAGRLGIPFYVWDFEEEYKKKVVEYMVDGYRRGETPNPDVMCNREIKFGLFLKRALELGADYVATGHYAKLQNCKIEELKNAKNNQQSCNYAIFQSRDSNKDQSYFLWTLTQNELKYCLFPIGDYLKSEVRAIALKAGLPTAAKKDSQGICFLGQVSLTDFLRAYIPEKRGNVLNLSGQKLGEHRGAHFFTIGQRHLGVSGIKYHVSGGQGEIKRHYISEKNMKTNTLIVAEGHDNPALYQKEIILRDVNFLSRSYFSNSREWWNKGIKVLARVKYRQPLAKAVLLFGDKRQVIWTKNRDRKSSTPHVANYMSLIFDVPQKFVASGQSAVFYDARGRLLGGGVIQNS